MAFAIVVAVVGVIALLLAMPLDIEFDAAWPATRTNTVRARWGFGVLRFRLDSAGDEAVAPAASRVSADKAELPPEKGGAARVLAALRKRPFRRRLLRFVRSLWRAVHNRKIDVSIRAGTGDPAETGWLWGALGPLSAWLQTRPDCRVRLEPDFVEATAEFAGRGRFTIVPLQILLLTAALLVSPAIWRGMARPSA